MKKSTRNFVAAIAFTALTAGVALVAGYAQAKYTHPIWDMRRTLSMAFGQHRIALEAPLGMCFFDESQYMESALIKQLRGLQHNSGDGLLMAVFADCKEIEKFAQLPQLAAETMPGVDPPTANLNNRGMITWLAPKLGRAPLGLAEYLDMREPAFLDDVKKSLSKGYSKSGASQDLKMADNVTAKILSGAPDQYRFDDRVTRTESGVSVSYTTEFVSEYKQIRQFGAIGTTMLRHFPVQVVLLGDGQQGPRSQEEAHKILVRFLAQVAKLNP